MKHRPLLVEFIGLPAGGKTTLAAALATDLLSIDGQSYIAATRDFRRLRDNRRLSLCRVIGYLWFTITHIRLFCSVMVYVLAANPTTTGLLRGAVLFRAFYTTEQLRRNNPDCVVMEEGFLQMAWSVAVYQCHLPADRLARLIRQVAKGYRLVVVWVRISPQTATERFIRRGLGGRLAVLREEELLDVFRNGARGFAKMVASCKSEAVTVVCVDGVANRNQSIQAIQRAIAGYSRGMRHLDLSGIMVHAGSK